MRARIVLPEGSQIADLPAFDWQGLLLVVGVGGQLVLDGPAANAGTIGFKVQPPVKFTGRSTVGGGRLGGEQFGEEASNGLWPGGMMIAARDPWRPKLGFPLGAGAQILTVEFIKARSG